jgi:multisubunit Na+/H+ antiporter MnhF subunit
MTARAAAPDRSYDPVRFHRGSRGLAAFLTIINGLAVLAFGALVAPTSGVGAPLGAWLSIAGIAAGIAHLVAVYGLIRGRAWSGRLVAYLAAAGIGASVFAILLITRAGESVLGASSASDVGYFVWMIGSWLVAARFALKPFRAPVTRASRPATTVPSPLAQGLAPWVSPRPAGVASAA